MRSSLVLCCLAMGCATVPATRGDEPDCITVIATTEGSQIYRNGKRVLGDDLVSATEASSSAYTLAVRSRAHDWYGVASLIVGGVLLVPGVGLLAAGAARSSTSNTATGAVLTVGGAGGLVAGALLVTRSRREAGRAVDIYNEERHHCR